jgi:type 1 glutamine amidotransferase
MEPSSKPRTGKSFSITTLLAVTVLAGLSSPMLASDALNILSFNGDTGFVHDSKPLAEKMIVDLAKDNGWTVTTTSDPAFFTEIDLAKFDVIVFANNCGTESPIFEPDQQVAFQNFIRSGGGFVGIHCAGAIWHETGDFKDWYEKLIGTKLVAHPPVQNARLTVENRNNVSTLHLPVHWSITDEWHRFGSNPRENVNVLISLDESSYQGKDKMFGDHPISWYQEYDGGRSFFTTLGHTKEIYGNQDYRNHILGGIKLVAGLGEDYDFEPIQKNLVLDLNADKDVELEDGDRVKKWSNQVASSPAKEFVKQDEGRAVKGTGRPGLKLQVPEIRGHNTLVFNRQELVNHHEDAFDHLLTGSGYTWFAVIAPYTQLPGLKDVSSFFGNLRNDSNYEGVWGNFADDNRPWMGSRSGKTFGRFDENNPMIIADAPLQENRYYLLIGRMGDGTGKVPLELFINDVSAPAASGVFPVYPAANASKMAVGQERDATNHPGKESFDGEIARLLIYDRPLDDEELAIMADKLKMDYSIR